MKHTTNLQTRPAPRLRSYKKFVFCSGGKREQFLMAQALGKGSPDDVRALVGSLSARNIQLAAANDVEKLIAFSEQHPEIWIRAETFDLKKPYSVVCLILNGVLTDFYDRRVPKREYAAALQANAA